MRYLLFVLTLSLLPLGAIEPLLNYGQYEIRFDYYSTSADQYFDTYKNELPVVLDDTALDYEDKGYGIDIRYGATPYTTLVLRGRFKDLSLDGPGMAWSSDGFESYYVGAQFRKSAGVFHSFQMNIGYQGDGSYNANDPLPLGRGEGSWEMSTSYFFSLNPYHAYALFDMGYRFRGGDLANEWILRSMFSYEFSNRTEFKLKYESVESTDTSRKPFDFLTYPRERGGQEIGAGLTMGLGQKLSLNLDYSQVINGRNIYKTDGYKVGFSYLF